MAEVTQKLEELQVGIDCGQLDISACMMLMYKGYLGRMKFEYRAGHA